MLFLEFPSGQNFLKVKNPQSGESRKALLLLVNKRKIWWTKSMSLGCQEKSCFCYFVNLNIDALVLPANLQAHTNLIHYKKNWEAAPFPSMI